MTAALAVPMISTEPRVLRDLAGRGLRVFVDGGEIVVEPASSLTPDLLQRIRSSKADILAFLTPSPLIAAAPVVVNDDPTLWTDPERGGFADGFAATVDEIFDVETRIDQGTRLIADTRAAKKPVPVGWTTRLQNLATTRLALRKDLTEKYPKALAAMADLVARLNLQEAWCHKNGNHPHFGRREDVYLANLAAYERLASAIDRAFDVVAEEEKDDPVRVSWVRAWAELRALGFREKDDVVTAIDGWDPDPREVVTKARAARGRGVGMIR